MPVDTVSDDPVLHLTLLGKFANQMIEYMVALKLASLVPGCRISNVRIPHWNIEHPAIDSSGPVARVGPWEPIDLRALANALNAGQIRRVEWSGYGQQMRNFLPRDDYQAVFVSDQPQDAGFGSEYLVCPVRAGDIVDGAYGDYPLTPVELYAELVAQTGLQPVFMGQTEPNAYMGRLRERFPRAIFLDTRGPMADFALIRGSKNIVVGVSTFVWLAAWLSHADQIFMTVSGLFNPMQQRLVNLLPLGDPRYRFWLFPINYGVKLASHAEWHQRMMPYCRLVPHELLRRQLDEAPRFHRDLAAFLGEFDERFYLAANADVAAAVGSGALPSGRAHYITYGFREYRHPFPVDGYWYVRHYPMAAIEVAQGDYADLNHHYVAIGKARGYRPVPP
ncbi:MAG TPA: hypothetical protein VGG99_05220 [Acetobacteraceae bacterium]|jgi:hypothetical protein